MIKAIILYIKNVKYFFHKNNVWNLDVIVDINKHYIGITKYTHKYKIVCVLYSIIYAFDEIMNIDECYINKID